jgi:ABC-type sugar transport system substrate-binding protein
MRRLPTRRILRKPVLAGCAAVVLAAVAATPASESRVMLTVQPPTICGQNLVYKHSDPDHVLSTLSPAARAMYKNYPYDVRSTPWATFAGKKPPWKIGYVSFPTNNPWKVNLYNELQKQFAAAKAKGLVSGKLVTYIQPSFATATPEQQDAAIQQMVHDGVDGIIVHALNSTAETPAIDAAGKAGVPVILISDVAPNSKYAINVFANNNAYARAATIQLAVNKGIIKNGNTTNVLIVRGVPGFSVETAQYESGIENLKPCPGINIVGTVTGQWNPAVTKTEVLKFLASNPEPISMVFVDASMSGVIEAFQEAGRPIPLMNFSGTSGGDLAWWLANKSKYQAVGQQYSGASVAWSEFRILLRVLGGKGLKIRDISLPPETVTNANLAQFATAGKPLTWIGDTRGAVDGWANNSVLDRFFKQPGTPDGF